ncbi:MAG: 23S rRNA (adenine(2503)-C(2))-methyltransferase RlmN [Oscillospiraceae bacterium]|nr:23S rRNA (adenine(2503)-C(2))-methyltransferase RlmN [Oscillospiraceae bacterium]
MTVGAETDFLSLTLSELEQELASLKLPKFRAKQIFEWLHVKRVVSFGEMTNLPEKLREELSLKYALKSLKVLQKRVSKRGDTVKYLYELSDGQAIETVFMQFKDRNSLCISSQVGCRMGCTFCASGVGGLVRNLAPSEMLLQVYETLRLNQLSTVNCPLSTVNIVIMGIGEPLDNFDNVLRFLELSPIGARHISLSTCGIVPQIDKLAEHKLGITLSVSLHAACDEDRSAIMPINRAYPLSELMRACRDYFEATRRRISFEYALIEGVNDSSEQAGRLAGLLRGELPPHAFHVNLIPVNDTGAGFRKSVNGKAFAEMLESRKINATIRRTMGDDINAACGQLRKEVRSQASRALSGCAEVKPLQWLDRS